MVRPWVASRQKRKAGTEVKSTVEWCLLTCSQTHDQLAFLYNPWPPAQPWYCLQWASPSHINQQLKCPIGWSDGGIFSAEIPSSHAYLGWVKLTKTNHYSWSQIFLEALASAVTILPKWGQNQGPHYCYCLAL